MAEVKKKKQSLTAKYAAKNKKRKTKTTSKDVPGNGLAKNAAKAMESAAQKRKKLLKDL